MICEKVQAELALYFGQSELPDWIREHLDTCPDCAALFAEQQALAEGVAQDSDFYLNDDDLDKSVAAVDDAIDAFEMDKVTRTVPLWRNYVPAVAALVIIVGLSLTLSMSDLFHRSALQTEVTTGDSALVLLDNGDQAYLEETDLQGLLEDFTIERYWQASEQLIDDLTEEEFEYLANNIDVGEIL